MKLELEQEIVFMHDNKIKQGIISQIIQNRDGVSYTIEFLDAYDDIDDIGLKSNEVFLTLNELFDSLRKDFETKKEWEK